jgi:hypothetical protein
MPPYNFCPARKAGRKIVMEWKRIGEAALISVATMIVVFRVATLRQNLLGVS